MKTNVKRDLTAISCSPTMKFIYRGFNKLSGSFKQCYELKVRDVCLCKISQMIQD